jgi:hypothetical protein
MLKVTGNLGSMYNEIFVFAFWLREQIQSPPYQEECQFHVWLETETSVNTVYRASIKIQGQQDSTPNHNSNETLRNFDHMTCIQYLTFNGVLHPVCPLSMYVVLMRT